MEDIEKLELQIKKLRNKLHKIIDSKNLLDKEVLEASQDLDKLLNKYNKLLRHKS